MPTRPSPGRLVLLGSVLLLALAVLLWWGRAATPGEGAARPGPATTATATGAATTPDSGLARVAASSLPRIAQDTLSRIRAGGPFPFAEDGGTFANREGILPPRPRGYYREYTVKRGTAGDRGPLRIVAGADGDRYWTQDHYDSFRQVEEGR